MSSMAPAGGCPWVPLVTKRFEADASRKRRAEVIDKVAATIILQNALETDAGSFVYSGDNGGSMSRSSSLRATAMFLFT
jgi:hypothetical protein